MLTVVCDGIFSEKNKKAVGKVLDCLVSEKTKNGFNARANNYSTVFIKSNKNILGKFVKARVVKKEKHYLVGELQFVLE